MLQPITCLQSSNVREHYIDYGLDMMSACVPNLVINDNEYVLIFNNKIFINIKLYL